MMYNEFLELSGKSESYISYKEESLDKGREKEVLSFWKILLLSNPNNDRGRSTCAWNAESSCGIVDRHTKRNTFITGER